MILGFSNPDRKLIELKPEDYLGIVRPGWIGAAQTANHRPGPARGTGA